MVATGHLPVTKAIMSKKPASSSPQFAPVEWGKVQTSPRISYPDGVPDRMSWRARETYSGSELTYRSQQARSIISLTSK